MRSLSRSWLPIAAAVIVAAVCVRLGLWQLDRLEQRKVRNAIIAKGFNAPPTPLDSILRERPAARFRRVVLRGRWEYQQEEALMGRTHNGSPGVHLLTPVTVIPGDHRVLVNRGWVYSPDARTVDLSRWREGDTGEFVGYVDEVPKAVTQAAAYDVYVVALADSSSASASSERPIRLNPPPFNALGPHLNYAVQWFSFAAIALIGTPLVLRHQRRRRDGPSIVSREGTRSDR
jgi:surfeit locus 1 family protein